VDLLKAVKEVCLLALTLMVCWAIFVLAPAGANLMWTTNRAVWHADQLVGHADTLLTATAPDVAGTVVAVRQITVATAQTMNHVEGAMGDVEKLADNAAKPKTKLQKAEGWAETFAKIAGKLLL